MRKLKIDLYCKNCKYCVSIPTTHSVFCSNDAFFPLERGDIVPKFVFGGENVICLDMPFYCKYYKKRGKNNAI